MTFTDIIIWALALFIVSVCAFILCPWPGKDGE